MSARLIRSTAPGQSIPLIALMILVLIAVVGLSVDVGNTFAQQRNTVRATNAAALAGMTALIQGGSDQTIGKVIQQSLQSNKIDGVYADPNTQASPDQRIIRAFYMDAKGNYLVSCNIGSCGSVPTGTTYIEVRVEGTVNTYFAKVVQRPTLPVKAQAFAGRCSPVQGVYPIGVQVSNLDSNGQKFNPPTDPNQQQEPYFGTFYNDTYKNGLSHRRIYMKDNGDGPGQFSWMRWQSAKNTGSANDLGPMVAGDGNLAGGFDEGIYDSSTNTFTWPDTNSQAPMVNGKVVYPYKPHEINTGDWIYGNTGVSTSNDVEAALKAHIDKQDVLILPIVTTHVKPPNAGGDSFYQITSLGAFYLTGIPGYGTGKLGDQNGGGANSFFDLVYIGTANSVACLSTPAVVSNTLGITGPVFVKPRWGLQQNPQPIAYEIIMDVSGSMSWNFAGQGSSGGNIKIEANTTGSTTTEQCEATLANPHSQTCGNGYDDPWWKVSERRIYVLKQALAGQGGFIENMRTNDTMRVIAFSTNGVTTSSAWTGDQTTLKTTVMNAGSYEYSPGQFDKYRTKGGTNGPSAIQKAAQILSNSPPPAPSNGLSYKHVVIYLTDGVANIFLDGTANTAEDVCPDYGGDARAYSDVWCQYDKTQPPPGYPANPHGMRPISEMIHQAGIMKDAHPEMQLFTVGIANVNPLGLDEVATSPKYMYLATDASLVPTVLDQIYDKVVGGCAETGTSTWIGKIDAAHTAGPPLPSLPTGVYGYAYLFNEQAQPVNVPWTGPGTDPRGAATNMIPIMTDLSGNMTYSLPPSAGLAAGRYLVRGYVYYKTANATPTEGGDGQSRQYSRLMQDGLEVQYVTFPVSPSQVLGSTVVVPPLNLDLNENVNLCK